MPEFTYSEASQHSNIVPDRGPARYFYGRTRILYDFNDLLRLALTENDARTTILIQGPPGAGKTALLEEMALDALEDQWDVFEINYDDLHNPAQMAQTLGKPYVSSKQDAFGTDVKVVGTEHSKEVAGDSSVSRVLEKMNPKKGILLILDEAQYVGRFFDTSNESAVASTLNRLHNGKLPHPVILLAAGLGMSKASFGKLGVSRFKGGCFVELGALGNESERAVIRDWLTKEGGAKSDPTVWMDAIAQKTHGWPQHFTAYGDAAARQIQHDHGEMTSAGLDTVHRVGAKRREAYYKQLTENISRKERSSLAGLLINVAPADQLDREDTEEFLSRYLGPDKAKDLFRRATEKGVLHSHDGAYSIPIPSMQTWLLENYGRERVYLPSSPQLIPPPYLSGVRR